MADGPLEKPAHLQPADDGGSWIEHRRAGALALGIGVLSFLIAAIVHGQLSSMPDLWLTIPGFVATGFAAATSIALREPKGYWLWGLGIALAAAAIVLGWFLVLAIIIIATAIVILILHAVL